LARVFEQDAEKIRQPRSRIVKTLNVPQRVRLGPSLAAALLDELFEHPAESFGWLGRGRLSKHGVCAAVCHFSAELLALEEDDAAIGADLVAEFHIGFEPSPAKEFDGAAGNLTRCAGERALEGLKISKNLVVGCLVLVADSHTRELAFGGDESHGVDLHWA
jgi:hypothetical protein